MIIDWALARVAKRNLKRKCDETSDSQEADGETAPSLAVVAALHKLAPKVKAYSASDKSSIIGIYEQFNMELGNADGVDTVRIHLST
jgi:hypothetical protein